MGSWCWEQVCKRTITMHEFVMCLFRFVPISWNPLKAMHSVGGPFSVWWDSPRTFPQAERALQTRSKFFPVLECDPSTVSSPRAGSPKWFSSNIIFDQLKDLPDYCGFIGDALREVPFEFCDVDYWLVEGLHETFDLFGDDVWEAFGCEFDGVQLFGWLLLGEWGDGFLFRLGWLGRRLLGFGCDVCMCLVGWLHG